MKALRLILPLLFLAAPSSAADFFPLQQGNVWTYQKAGTGQTFSIQVGSPFLVNQRVYYMLRGYLADPVLVRLNEHKTLVALNEETGSEQVLASFAASQGAWWDAPARPCRQQGQTAARGTLHDGPAGPIHDVREIEYRVLGCADAGVESEQYAANIGMVRRISTTIAGPVTFDLVRARVGNLEVNAATHSGFSVSLDRSPQGEPIALLRVQTNSPVAQTLHFPSSQEFDAEVRDEAGHLFWKWSDGQVFAQTGHDLTVVREWATPVALPALQPGNYFLQAWISTAGQIPQYAGSVPLVIAPAQ